jgi:hypothetical protein
MSVKLKIINALHDYPKILEESINAKDGRKNGYKNERKILLVIQDKIWITGETKWIFCFSLWKFFDHSIFLSARNKQIKRVKVCKNG